MKYVYPIILSKAKEGGYDVAIPDLDINTQGKDLAEAMFMARDAIGMWICYELDKNNPIPPASYIDDIKIISGQLKNYVDIDIEEYRRAHDNRTIRKNLTLPSWLNDRAEKEGVNFSQILQKALKDHLKIKGNR